MVFTNSIYFPMLEDSDWATWVTQEYHSRIPWVCCWGQDKFGTSVCTPAAKKFFLFFFFFLQKNR